MVVVLDGTGSPYGNDRVCVTPKGHRLRSMGTIEGRRPNFGATHYYATDLPITNIYMQQKQREPLKPSTANPVGESTEGKVSPRSNRTYNSGKN